MRNAISGRIYSCLQHRNIRKNCFSSSLFFHIHHLSIPPSPKPNFHRVLDGFKTRCIYVKPTSYVTSLAAFRQLHATTRRGPDDPSDDSDGEVDAKAIEFWEEEDEAEPEIGDGGEGGGIVLQNCAWGERALSLAREVLLEFGEGMELFAFKTSPRGYIYVRLDKLSHEYGCPSIEEIQSFHHQFGKRLDELGASGELPDDLAVDVSSPGGARLLRVPDDLLRFKDKPMAVTYLEDTGSRSQEKTGVYFLDSIETESECCVWRLADVKENRDPSAKGKPLNRKQKDARLRIAFTVIKRVNLYIRCK